MWRRPREQTSQKQLRAENAIADSLDGGDNLPAWNAVWDLVQSADSQGKDHVLQALREYVDASVAGDNAAAKAQAQEFEQAIDRSMTRLPLREQVLPSPEVREQHKADQAQDFDDALTHMGVRPGEGLPMWAMYMTRRSKRTWG